MAFSLSGTERLLQIRDVDYRACDLGTQPLPFGNNSFDFATYTDVIEHHSFSPKRVLREIQRVLVPGEHLIVTTPNHASIYNRLLLLFGNTSLAPLCHSKP